MMAVFASSDYGPLDDPELLDLTLPALQKTESYKRWIGDAIKHFEDTLGVHVTDVAFSTMNIDKTCREILREADVPIAVIMSSNEEQKMVDKLEEATQKAQAIIAQREQKEQAAAAAARKLIQETKKGSKHKRAPAKKEEVKKKVKQEEEGEQDLLSRMAWLEKRLSAQEAQVERIPGLEQKLSTQGAKLSAQEAQLKQQQEAIRKLTEDSKQQKQIRLFALFFAVKDKIARQMNIPSTELLYARNHARLAQHLKDQGIPLTVNDLLVLQGSQSKEIRDKAAHAAPGVQEAQQLVEELHGSMTEQERQVFDQCSIFLNGQSLNLPSLFQSQKRKKK
jgi:multidrug efflux pump subunit AcrB